MSDSGEVLTLEGQAVDEILREAKRSKELANEFGLYGGRRRDALPNKRFLNNTLVSTLRHSYREERKQRDGSYRKFQQHINSRRRRGRNYYRNQGDRDVFDVEPENDGPEPDYGEFDAIAYTEKCTDLYIRDSHRKHFFMRGNFVEKQGKGSSSDSEESYTEYENPPADKWKHDRFEGKWSDTGSADEYATGMVENYDSSVNETNKRETLSKKNKQREKYDDQKVTRKSRQSGKEAHLSGRKRKNVFYQGAGTSKYDEGGESSDDEFTDLVKKKIKKEGYDSYESDEHSGKEFVNSGTESADNMEKPNKNKGKGKKTKKLPHDGKALWEKISSRSMYADIEEMKLSKTDQAFDEHDKGKEADGKYSKKIKVDRYERGQKYLKQKIEAERVEEELRRIADRERVEEEMRRIADRERKEEEMRDEAERERKEESMRRLVERKKKEEEMRFEAERHEEHMRRVADMHWKEKHMRRAAFEHFRGSPQRRPFRGRPFMRPGPFFRGRPPRGFRGGFPMFPPVNPFYASLFYEMDPYLIEKFIKEHGHKLLKKYKLSKSRSRSRSHSRSRSRRYKKKKRRYHSDSDSSYSRDRSRSRSRRHSSSRSSSYSRTRSRDHRRSYSRDRRRSYSKDRRRSYSRDRSRSHSRDHRRSNSRSRRRYSSSDHHSRSRSRSRSKYRNRSYSYDSHKNSSYEESHKSHSHSSRKHKKHRKHKKSKHRKHSKSKHRKKSSESESGDESNSGEEIKDSDRDTDVEGGETESQVSEENEEEYLEDEIEEGEQDEQSEGEIVSDDDDGLENVSEESGEAWSSS